VTSAVARPTTHANLHVPAKYASLPMYAKQWASVHGDHTADSRAKREHHDVTDASARACIYLAAKCQASVVFQSHR
jgi:hypothetical protein